MAPVTSPSSRDSPLTTTTTPGAGGGLSSFVRGGLSGGVNVLVTFPINKVMFRQQLQGSTSAEAVAAMRREGGRNLYRGLGPPLMQKAVSTSLMFGIYTDTQRQLDGAGWHPVVSHGAASLGAGATEAVLTPFERVQTLLQDPRYNQRFKNTSEVFAEMWKELGAKEFYRGLSAVVLRNSVSNMLFFVGREPLMDAIGSGGSGSGSGGGSGSGSGGGSGSGSGGGGGGDTKNLTGSFISGAILGGAISCIVYPVKRHLNYHYNQEYLQHIKQSPTHINTQHRY